jgi:hypothetical protein
MPGWQIALIAAAAALAAATVAVLLDRARAARGYSPGRPVSGGPGPDGPGRAEHTRPTEPLLQTPPMYPGCPVSPDRHGSQRCALPAGGELPIPDGISRRAA